MRLVSFLALLITASGVAIADEPTHITVASCNVHWANRRVDQLADAIVSSGADVVLLQETTPQIEAFLQTRFKNVYPHFYATGHQGKYQEERFVIASKHPLTNVDFHPPTVGLFGFYTAICKWDGLDIYLCNTHLTPFLVPQNASPTSLYSALTATEDRHFGEIKAVCNDVDSSRPTIIAGDFNSTSTLRAPSYLKSLGLVDSFASIHENADAEPTWHWQTPRMLLKLRIDYVFHTNHFRTIRSRVVPIAGSDHSLVVSELEYVEASDSKKSHPADSLPKPSSVNPQFPATKNPPGGRK